MFNALHLDVSTKYRIHNLIQNVRVVNFRLKVDLLSLRTFGLNVVLPKMALFLGSGGSVQLGGGRTGAFQVTLLLTVLVLSDVLAVLLIITDGIITDLEETKRAIISASELPLSLIIVGVGDEDFTDMNALDSDDRLLRSGGLVAKRDIVQFVEMKQFVLGGGTWNKELLARSVLAEVPNQLASYMKMQSFNPLVRT